MLSTRLARVPSLAARALGRRAYTDVPGPQHKGFSKKEKAHEDQFVYEKEKAELKKLREDIDKKREELERLQKSAEKVENNVNNVKK